MSIYVPGNFSSDDPRVIAQYLDEELQKIARVLGNINELTLPIHSFETGSFTLQDGEGAILTKRMQITGNERVVLLGTSRLRIT